MFKLFYHLNGSGKLQMLEDLSNKNEINRFLKTFYFGYGSPAQFRYSKFTMNDDAIDTTGYFSHSAWIPTKKVKSPQSHGTYGDDK